MEMNVVIENAGKAENSKKTVVSAPNPLSSHLLNMTTVNMEVHVHPLLLSARVCITQW